MGIQFLKVPKGHGHQIPGPLSLPASFDQDKWASKWVKVGPAVAAASEREWIHGTTASADGWEVWRNPTTSRPHKVSLQSGEHVLLCRARSVQQAVNAICGNVGKQRLSQERTGEVITGADGMPTDDPGMLGEDRLAAALGPDPLMQEEGEVSMNPVEVEGQRVESPVAATLASRRGRR